ncbi:MAG: ATP-dependent helicase [Muribaculaceae bacterium]
MDNYLNELNEQQQAAVVYNEGPQLVIAGAGSGKTRVLTYKIVHLLNGGMNPRNIMALTFTNKAARTMRERITALTSPEISSQLWMGTFHSIFARILRHNAERIGFKSDYTIYDANDSKTLIRQIIKDMNLDDKEYKPSTIQNIISNAKNALVLPADYEKNDQLIKADKIAKRPKTYLIYKAYCARCKVAGAMDFDDILLYMNILLRDNTDICERYRNWFGYVLVDEYQDTNFAQHMIILQLTKAKGNLFVVGDDAQSIYSFRGANIDNILRLKEVYPNVKVFKLEKNYRSTKNIIEAANSLIEKNRMQIKKHSFTDNATGNKMNVIQCYSDYEESYVVANQIISIKANQGDMLNSFAILYRTNAQSRLLEEALRKRNIPYRIYGGMSFYQRKEVKDAVCYFRLAINPDDDEALRRVINYPSRGIGDTTIGKVQHCAIENNVSMWQVINNPQQHGLAVSGSTLKKLGNFAELINSFIELNASGADAAEMTQFVLRRSGLYDLTNCDNTPENISKRENLEELMNSARGFVDISKEEDNNNESLTGFLAEVSLSTDQDENNDADNGPKVTLMTAHSAKGLEFKNVIITGVEEDLFPSLMSKDSIRQIEEERRLLYVAITRAMSTCTLTFATSRYYNGQTKVCVQSRFIGDIDHQYLSLAQTSSSARNLFESYGTKPASNRWQQSSDDYSGFGGNGRKRISHNDEADTEPIKPTRPSQPNLSQFTPVSKAKSATPSDNDNQLHTADELAVGMAIRHIRFGEGVITKIDTTGNDAKVIVSFSGNDTRTLLLKFAKFDIL